MGSNTHTNKIQTIATHWDQWNLLQRDNDFDRYADMLIPTPKVYSAMDALEKMKVPEITEWISLFCRTCFAKTTSVCKIKLINDMDKSIVEIKNKALGIIMESTLMEGKDKHSLTRKEARYIMTVCNYFHTISYIKRVCISNFHYHQKIRNWLNYWMRMIHDSDIVIQPSRGEDKVIYMVFDTRSKYSYIGQTKRSSNTRFMEHIRSIMDPHYSTNDIPAYQVFRRLGASNLICLPMFGIKNGTEWELRKWERRAIDLFRPKLNCPYVYQYLPLNNIIKPRRKIGQSKKTVGRHRAHEQFTTTGYGLTRSPKIGIQQKDIYRLALDMGNLRRRFTSSKLVRLNSTDKARLLREIIGHLQGTPQKVAIHRFEREVDRAKRHTIELRIPQGGAFDLKNRILQKLRADCRSQHDTMIVHFRTIMPPSIRDLIANQKRWNRELHMGMNWSCTCKNLELLGLKKEEGHEHICTR